MSVLPYFYAFLSYYVLMLFVRLLLLYLENKVIEKELGLKCSIIYIM